VKFLYLLEEMGSLYHDSDISITESHQSSKTSLAGTAVEMAESLGVDPRHIDSIRDKDTQKDGLAIPPEYMDQHALHMIDIGTDDCRISFRTEVHDLDTYLTGIVSVLRRIDELSPGRHRSPDLIREKML